jgi:hypothetical protein
MASMNMIEILARLAFAFSLLILFIAFTTMAAAVAWNLFRYLRPRQEPTPIPVPETDFLYYRQRHRRGIQLLLDGVAQLSRELKAAQ